MKVKIDRGIKLMLRGDSPAGTCLACVHANEHLIPFESGVWGCNLFSADSWVPVMVVAAYVDGELAAALKCEHFMPRPSVDKMEVE